MEPFKAKLKEGPGAAKYTCVVIALTGARVNGEPELLVVLADGEVRTALPTQLEAEMPLNRLRKL